MLKKISWVIAALFVASAMIFIGCQTELAEGLDDGSGPVPEDDLVIEGAGIVLGKMGGNQAATTIDGAKVTFKDASATSVGFYYEFPREAEKYPNVIFYFKVVSASKGRVGLLIKNRDMSNYTGVTSDQDPQYQLNDVGSEEGWEFDTGLKKTSAFKDKTIGFQHQAWNPDGNGNVEYTIEVLKIVFPGSGSGDPKPVLGPKGVVFIPGKDADDKDDDAFDTIVDTSLAGTTYTLKSGTNFTYNFPTVAQNSANSNAKVAIPVNIERDYDYVDIVYTISNIDKTSGGAGSAKIAFNQIGGGNASYTEAGGSWGDFGTAGSDKTHRIQTWGSGGKGGFVIYFNSNDTKSSGCDSFDIKITKITFSKGTRYNVNLYSPQTGLNVPTFTVLDGNSLGSTLTPPAYRGWTFAGYYAIWDYYGLVKAATPKNLLISGDDIDDIGTKATGSLPVISKSNKTFFIDPDGNIMQDADTGGTDLFGTTTDLPLGVITGYGEDDGDDVTKTAIVVDPEKGVSLYAYWFSQVLPPLTINNPVLGGTGLVNNAYKLTVDDVEYWVIGYRAGDTIPSDEGDKILPSSNASSRLGYSVPAEAAVYDRITISYTTLAHEDTAVVKPAGAAADAPLVFATALADGNSIWGGSDVGYPNLANGTDGKGGSGTLTLLNKGGFVLKANTYADSHVNFFLIRITKIEFTMD
jgi:hypothetical protein